MSTKNINTVDISVLDSANDCLFVEQGGTLKRVKASDVIVPKVKTKNLMDLSFEHAWIDTNTGEYKVANFLAAASPDYIAVQGGETYTFSWQKHVVNSYLHLYEYREDRSFIRHTDLVRAHGESSATITLDSSCAYIRIYFYSDSATAVWTEIIPERFQMEKGAVATEYVEPYCIDPNVIDYSPTESIVKKQTAPLKASVDQMLDNFVEGEKITYSFGEADYTKLGISSNFSTIVGRSVPLMKSSLAGDVRGVTLCLAFNKSEMPVVLELYDQNQTLIKKLAEETITAYQIAGLQDGTYAAFHTFACEFNKEDIKTDAAYLRIYIPNLTTSSSERLGLGRVADGTTREEIDVNITPTCYTTIGRNIWVADTMGDGSGGYVNLPEMTFLQITEKALVADVPESTAVLDYKAYGLPVLEFSGDISAMTKDVAVDLAYKYGEREGTCTVKWQGSSSIVYPKKNYTVKFDTAFEAKEGWGEQKKYCLKANYIEFSHSRNICCAKLWGGVVKSRTPNNPTLSALVNGGAIDGFPICVVINGEYKGLYTFNIPKDGWMFGMGEGANEAVICADASKSGACSFDALATLDGDFEVEYAPDDDNTDWIKTSVNRLIQACMDSDGTDLDTTIAQYLDWESAIDYYAHCLVTQNYDGLTKNYILATYDGTKWFFSAYDMDSTFGIMTDGKGFIKVSASLSVESAASVHRVFKLIKNYKADKLKARYNELVLAINGALSEETITETFLNFAGSIPKALLDEEVRIWTTLPSTSVNNISQILDFNRRRRAFIDKQIEAL